MSNGVKPNIAESKDSLFRFWKDLKELQKTHDIAGVHFQIFSKYNWKSPDESDVNGIGVYTLEGVLGAPEDQAPDPLWKIGM